MIPGQPSRPQSSASISAGRVLAGWLLQAQLGIGGMGTVFRATHVKSGQEAALKVLHALQEGESATAKRFRREVQALARIEHPAIVRVLAEALDHSPPFFCMELLPGGSLAARIVQGRDKALPGQAILDPDWLAGLAQQLAAGLAVVHGAHILHRDLKPMNVLLTADGHAKLGDFGLAKLQDVTALTAPNQVMGSVPYMAPEVLRGEGFSERSDLYQLGATLFDAATGHHPYSVEQLMAVVAHRPLPALPDLAGLAPELAQRLPWFAATLTRLMADSPADRFSSAAELAAHLGSRLGPAGPSPGSPARAVRVSRPAPANESRQGFPSAEAGPTAGTASGDAAPVTAGSRPRRFRPALLLGISLALWALCLAGFAARWLRPAGSSALATPPSDRPPPRSSATSASSVGAVRGPTTPPSVTVGAGSVHLWFDGYSPPNARLQFRPVSSSSGRTERLKAPVRDLLVEGLAPGTQYDCRMLADGRETPFGFSTPQRVAVPGGVRLLEDSGKLGEPKLMACGPHMAALWRRGVGAGLASRVEVAQSQDGGLTWSQPETLASSSGTLFSLALAIGPAEAVAAWREGEPGTSEGGVCVRCWSVLSGRWGEPLRARVGGSLSGLGIVSHAGEIALLAVMEFPPVAGKRVLARATLDAGRTVLGHFEPVLTLPAKAAGNLRLAQNGSRVMAALDCRRDDQTWDVIWTRTDLSHPGARPWRMPQPLADAADDVGKFDLAALGDDFLLHYEAAGQLLTRVITDRDATLTPRQRLATDDLLVSSGALAVGDEGAYLAYLACATPVRPVGALRLLRSTDGREWRRLPGLDLRKGLPVQVRLALSGRRLLALISDELAGLTVCPVPMPGGP